MVRRLVDAEDLRQPGDPEDLQDPLLRADQIQRAVVDPHPPQAPDQHPEAGGVEEPDLVQVDDELVAALADQVDEQLPQPRRRIDIDLALHVDDPEPKSTPSAPSSTTAFPRSASSRPATHKCPSTCCSASGPPATAEPTAAIATGPALSSTG